MTGSELASWARPQALTDVSKPVRSGHIDPPISRRETKHSHPMVLRRFRAEPLHTSSGEQASSRGGRIGSYLPTSSLGRAPFRRYPLPKLCSHVWVPCVRIRGALAHPKVPTNTPTEHKRFLSLGRDPRGEEKERNNTQGQEVVRSTSSTHIQESSGSFGSAYGSI